MFHRSRGAAALALLSLASLSERAFAISAVPSRPLSTSGAVASRTRHAAVIKGHITEKETGQPIQAAQVSAVVGTSRIGAVTDLNGDYTIRGAPSGAVRLSVSRIGFTPATQIINVPADGDVTADFALTRAALRLEEVVTTATGEQARREIGNSVASVKADSISKTQPVTNISEMLQARASGVQVIQTQGVLGASPNIRIRGVPVPLSMINFARR